MEVRGISQGGQPEGYSLSESEISTIASVLKTDKYTSNPVPANLANSLSSDLSCFVTVSYSMKSKLSALYGSEGDFMELLQADWEEAFGRRALRLHRGTTISFPTHIALANGEAVELSISQNSYEGGLPWYLSYAPNVENLRLSRDHAASREAELEQESSLPVPPLAQEAFLNMQSLSDYLSSSVPDDVMEEMESHSESFDDFVWVSRRWRAKITELAGHDINVMGLLGRDWSYALKTGTMRFYEGKVIFPISIFREDGQMLAEVSIRREARGDVGTAPANHRNWFVCYIDTFVRQKAIVGKALTDWAHIGSMDDMLHDLASIALKEQWEFEGSENSESLSILKSYLTYTFYRLKWENKILEDEEKGIAAFNTGLVDETYEAIFACFTPSTIDAPWRFAGFCKAGSRGLGKQLVNAFDPLPARAQYFERKEDLLFDTSRTLQRDVDHILLDNIDRLPAEFLREELRGSNDALSILEEIEQVTDDSLLEEKYDELRDAVESNVRIKRRLINRLDDSIELAQKRVEWNFKTAVPAFYPTKNTMSLLLPLDLTEDERPDVALVVELMESGAYMGQTILTMEMAYNNARLICRPDSDWLNTSMKLSL